MSKVRAILRVRPQGQGHEAGVRSQRSGPYPVPECRVRSQRSGPYPGSGFKVRDRVRVRGQESKAIAIYPGQDCRARVRGKGKG